MQQSEKRIEKKCPNIIGGVFLVRSSVLAKKLRKFVCVCERERERERDDESDTVQEEGRD